MNELNEAGNRVGYWEYWFNGILMAKGHYSESENRISQW